MYSGGGKKTGKFNNSKRGARGPGSKFRLEVAANSADKVEVMLELSQVDEALASESFPGDDARAVRSRELFLDFLRMLRPAPKNLNGKRSIAAYFEGSELTALFRAWRHLIGAGLLKSNDSLTRMLAVIVEQYVRQGEAHGRIIRVDGKYYKDNEAQLAAQEGANIDGPMEGPVDRWPSSNDFPA